MFKYIYDSQEYNSWQKLKREKFSNVSFPANITDEILERFNIQKVEYTAPERTLEQEKQEKIMRFKNYRDREEVANVEYNGHIFDYDDKAQKRINIAYQRMSVNPEMEIQWTTADNDNVAMKYADFAALLDTVMIRSGILHNKYRQLKEQIGACTTVEQVQAICWTESGEA